MRFSMPAFPVLFQRVPSSRISEQSLPADFTNAMKACDLLSKLTDTLASLTEN